MPSQQPLEHTRVRDQVQDRRRSVAFQCRPAPSVSASSLQNTSTHISSVCLFLPLSRNLCFCSISPRCSFAQCQRQTTTVMHVPDAYRIRAAITHVHRVDTPRLNPSISMWSPKREINRSRRLLLLLSIPERRSLLGCCCNHSGMTSIRSLALVGHCLILFSVVVLSSKPRGACSFGWESCFRVGDGIVLSEWLSRSVVESSPHSIGEGERVCVLDSGFTPSPRLRTLYEVETINFTSDPSARDELNHGTASISVYLGLLSSHRSSAVWTSQIPASFPTLV